MKEQIIIEELKLADLSQAVAMINSLVPWEVAMKEAQEAFEQMRRNPDCGILVAKQGKNLLGTVTVACNQTLAGRFASIEDVVVLENCQGQGIGSKLMDAADTFAAARGCDYIIVVSSGHRTRAHRFYEKCGFLEDVRGFRKDCL
ncbi:MAG: GNAT family N-acetyltransferase [Oscillospiraceae bacterium]|nr:GNAT family N-acetyltransferase [Oscillospiraceae bacterium]